MAELYIEHDPHGALVHVKRRDTRECVGCVEAGLFEVVRGILYAEWMAAAQRAALGGKDD